jgi:type II secretory pathway component PulK
MKPALQHGRRASALLLVMWALLLLSATVLAWAAWIQNDIALHADANRALEARAMAHSGIAIALHPLVSLQTPLPDEDIAPGMGYRVTMVSEGAKLNINWLLQGEEPRKLTLLKQWLERRGLDFQQRETFVDCLLDYVDADNVKRLNGAEDDGDYHPANRELRSVEEIAKVRGSGPLVSQPGWQDDLTIYSQGPIDLNSAGVDVLRLLPGLSETRIQHFVKFRQGPDGRDGTEDDAVFPNLNAIQQFLGLSAAQFQELSGLVSYKDPTMHITCTGHSGKVSRQVEVVVRKAGSNPQIMSWKE